MSKSLIAFGAALAVLAGVPTALAIRNVYNGVIVRLDPSARYEFSFVLDGERYVTDHDLTYDDCQGALVSIAQDPDAYKQGQGSYGCDVQQH